MNARFHRFQGYAMMLMLAAAAPVSAAEVMDMKNILDVIDGMRRVPMERAAVEALFGAKITKVTGNGYWTYHEGAGNIFDTGSKISKFGFMTKNDGTDTPVVYANFSEQCVPFAQVRQRFPDMVARGIPPSPHSRIPHVGYLYRTDDGEMTFAFTGDGLRPPECLVNVGFRKKTLPPSA